IIAAAFASHTRQRRAKLLGLVLHDHTPPWLRRINGLIMVYAFIWLSIGAFTFMHAHGDPIRLPNNTYAVDSGHGRPPIPFTREQFHNLRVRLAQSLSGFFLMFYLATTTDLLQSARNRQPRHIPII